MYLIFYEDVAQLRKIISHHEAGCFIKVLYSGKKIISVTKVDGKSEILCGFIEFIFRSIAADSLVCEYANGLPRMWATIFSLRIHSHIFGVLDYSDFDFKSGFHPKKIKKLLNRLYAEEYTIYGRNNPTSDLIDYINYNYNAKVQIRDRLDLPQIKKRGMCTESWAVYIAQPWDEVGNIYNARMQKALYEIMVSRLPRVYYCRHPRQTNVRLDHNHIIDGWASLEKIIQELGPPIIAVSLNSSLIYELQEIGINAIQISKREQGQTIFFNVDEALKMADREISSFQ